MKPISMQTVEEKRREILATLKEPTFTHEQKVTYLARKAENFLTVLDEPEGLSELMRCDVETRCICNLFEGEAPYRPRYICPDYEKFLKNGSEFLQLEPAKDLFDALNNLLILYHNVPSITNYPVYLGDLDTLLEPFAEGLDDATIMRALKLFFTNVDRTILDSFAHADIGPKKTRMGSLILKVEAELENAVPNITMRVSDETEDEFLLEAVQCALRCAKPSFANDKMFRSEITASPAATMASTRVAAATRFRVCCWPISPSAPRILRISVTTSCPMYWTSWPATWMSASASW